MTARAVMVAVAALALAAGSFLAFIRYELRPRHARLDPAATGLPLESVVIPSSSGARLAGWYLPGAGRGAVLLLHGAKSNRLVLVDRMRFLRDAGYSTLAIDFQAHGESTGDRITLGQLESLDARSALAWLRARLPAEPVAVLGISMGAAAALIGPPIDADAVIVESVGADFAGGVSNRLALKFGPLGRLFTPFVLGAMRFAAGIDASKLRPIDGIARLHKPIFVMTGAEDQKTTVAEARELFAGANPPKRYWETPGAQHWDLAFVGGDAYRERLLDFLGSTLRSSPG
jgi:pimeloyl-ACP methyl ester carboxylesterase